MTRRTRRIVAFGHLVISALNEQITATLTRCHNASIRLALVLGVAFAASVVYAVSAQQGDGPRYAPGTNDLLRPADYREWIFVGSSLGLDYRAPTPGQAPGFGNVFVNPSSYRAFLQTGKWPDKTTFVL